MKKRIYSTTLSVILVLFILLSLTMFILNKNIEGYLRGSKSANSSENNGMQMPVATFKLHSRLNQGDQKID